MEIWWISYQNQNFWLFFKNQEVSITETLSLHSCYQLEQGRCPSGVLSWFTGQSRSAGGPELGNPENVRVKLILGIILLLFLFWELCFVFVFRSLTFSLCDKYQWMNMNLISSTMLGISWGQEPGWFSVALSKVSIADIQQNSVRGALWHGGR